ncbi:DUF5133 domain-containing protein [Streptomyces sp. NPDC001966]
MLLPDKSLVVSLLRHFRAWEVVLLPEPHDLASRRHLKDLVYTLCAHGVAHNPRCDFRSRFLPRAGPIGGAGCRCEVAGRRRFSLVSPQGPSGWAEKTLLPALRDL